MRKLGNLLNLTKREVIIRSACDFSNQSGDQSLLDSLRSNNGQYFDGVSFPPGERFHTPINNPLDFANAFSSQEEELARTLQHHATAALRLTRLVGEAEKAAISAERSRIAHDLHDSVTQCLTGIYTQLEAAAQLRQANPDLADSCVYKAKELSHKGLQEIRRLVTALQPDAAQYVDLAENLRELAHESSCEAGTRVRCNLRPTVRLVPPDIGYHLVQIAREAVGNALRYAHAKSVVLELRFTDARVDLSIEDDGVGFRLDSPTAFNGFGLNAMRQRASRIQGGFSLRTSPGTGTSVQISARCPAWGRA
jgi:signal transduction histidine kinase